MQVRTARDLTCLVRPNAWSIGRAFGFWPCRPLAGATAQVAALIAINSSL